MAKKKAAKKAVARKPKQASLNGMEDREIAGLQVLAEDYAEVRDRRIAVGKKEQKFKQEILAEMHKNKKTHYEYGGVVIDVVTEKEKVKVKKAKAPKGGPADPDGAEVVEEEQEAVADAEGETEGEPDDEEELEEGDSDETEEEAVKA